MSKKYITLPRADLRINRPFFYRFLFFLPKRPRPDFTKEALEIKEIQWNDSWAGNMKAEEPFFTNIDPVLAVRNGWFENGAEYQTIAALEFTRRYPAHGYSKKILKMYGYTKQQMLDYVTGAKLLRIITKRGITRVHVEK